MQVFRTMVIAVSLWFAAENGTVLSLALSAGALAAIDDLTGRLFAPIEALAQEFQTIQRSSANAAGIRRYSQREHHAGR